MIAQHNNLKGSACKPTARSHRHQRYILLVRVKVITPRRRHLIGSAMTTPSPTIQVPSVPRQLVAPPPTEVDRAHLTRLFGEETQQIHPAFLRDQLRLLSDRLIAGLRAVKLSPGMISAPYPERASVTMSAHTFAFCPTHILAVYDANTGPSAASPASPRPPRVTVFPAHEHVLRMNCTRLPTLAPSAGALAAGITTEAATLPVTPLRVPSAATFHTLFNFLYTKNTQELRAALRPDATGDSAQVNACKRLILVYGVYSNAMALGVINEKVGAENKSLYDIIEEEWAQINTILRS